jgi:uncharacterized membrane protein
MKPALDPEAIFFGCAMPPNGLELAMNDAKLSSSRTATFPLLALLFASLTGVALMVLRVTLTHDWKYFFLAWNLFLAWLPLIFALGVHERHHRGERHGWRLWGLATLWLLFLPNAPYIFTDLVHLTARFTPHFWADLSLVLLVALTGFLLGFVSLYLMQGVVAERFGHLAGWVFIVGAALVSAFGIYLGRFLRWNSWDVVMHPLNFSHAIGHLATHPLADPNTGIFPVFFATFLFLGYLMLYALTHLHPQRRQMGV